MFPHLFNTHSGCCNVHMHRYPKEQGYIYSVAAFREIMHRECARSKRNGHGFAFVVLQLPQGGESRDTANRIVELVGDWLRVTDHAGWLQQNRRLAILLYACATEDANGFVERLRKGGKFEALKYDIYSYPDNFPKDVLNPVTEVANG